MKLRKIIFWCHLCAGVFVGTVVLIMSATGVLLTYERQMVQWADRGFRSAPPPGAGPVSVEALLSSARQAVPEGNPSQIVLHSDPEAPAEVRIGRRTIYFNPYSAAMLGEGSSGIRSFFQGVTAWHRWFGAEGEGRNIARSVTGACNLAFLFIVLSGLYLWWPRRWTRQSLRAVTWFRRGLQGRARDFNWHNAIGFWCLVPLVVIVASGVVMSYPWANNLVYRLTGSETPQARRGGPPAGPSVGNPRAAAENRQREGRPDGPRENQPQRGEARQGEPRGERETERGRFQGRDQRPGERTGSAAPVSLEGLDRLWSVAAAEVPGWQSIALRLPSSADDPVSFSIDRGNGARPDLRDQITLDRASGDVLSRQGYAQQSAGRKARSWLRFLHTGEAGGWIGQTIAGIASLGGVLLVYTGFAMAWRRFLAWLRRTARTREAVGERQ